ncbi:MAG: exonuclease domain-containing protein [Ruminococcaceae bacterium]|nr:exonuclease domain-containing protein [Oscillospiraceae bacterium]
MDYVIFDLEWNRYSKKVKLKCPDEIIQIGAVKYDENLNYAGSFNCFIRPSLYNKIETMVQEITGITMDTLKQHGVPFSKAFKSFREFMGRDCVLMSWGVQDAAILRENCIYYNRDINLGFLKNFADLQSYVAGDKRIESEQNQPGLKNSVISLGIEYDEKTLHNALVDATLSGEVFKRTFNKVRFEKCIFDARKISLHYKGIHITDIKSGLINKREFLMRCPRCGKFASKTSGWYRRGKSFFAIHRCRACKSDMLSMMEILLLPDENIKYKKKTSIIEKVEL